MATWAQFASGAGELAALGEQRLPSPGLVLVGTLRRDGWPRISPVESLVTDGQLYLGMMWQSRKALDLLRDPRCLVHSLVSDPDGSEGDLKLYGRAVDITDANERERYCQALHDAIDWRPDGDFHLFRVEIEQVGHIRVEGGQMRKLRWRPGEPVVEL